MDAKLESPELAKLAFDLDRAANVAPADSRAVVAKGALNIKNDARRRRTGSEYFPKLRAAITYESQATPTGGWADVGPEHGKPQGNMGHIPEYGALKTPPEPYMAPAAAAELPRFEKAMQDLAAKALEP
jgi:hypothetical protein